jgi:hypothetical protein
VERISELRTTANIPRFVDFLNPDYGGDIFLLNVGSYKSHTASIPEEGILHSQHRENLKYYIK